MSIPVIDAMGPALERTRQTLFRPFDLSKWFVIGFGCWLARLLDGGGTGLKSGLNLGGKAEAATPGPELPSWIEWGTWGVGVLVLIAVAALALVLVFTWLSSRGKFIFLDNVSRNRAAVAEPWNRFAGEARSLFLWRLGFALVAALVIAAVVAVGLGMGASSWWLDPPDGLAIFGALLMAAVVMVLALGIAAVALFLDSFVVPIMALERSTTSEAWRRFLSLFKRDPWAFVVYVLVVVAIHLVLAMAVILVGFGTCCLGFLLLAMPYLGTVVLLPVYVFLRALSLELLAALEPRFNVFDPTVWEREAGSSVVSTPPDAVTLP